MKVHVLEVFCLLSARGYKLSRPGFPDRHRGGSTVTFLASKLMLDDGTGEGGRCVSNVHLSLPGDLSDVHAFPETSMGEAGMKESGVVCRLIERERR